jgi:hypothetical protein
MRCFSFLLLLLFSLPLLSKEAFTHTGWNDLRICRHYAEVSQLLRPSAYAIPYISQLAWRQYYYNENLNISHEELKFEEGDRLIVLAEN